MWINGEVGISEEKVEDVPVISRFAVKAVAAAVLAAPALLAVPQWAQAATATPAAYCQTVPQGAFCSEAWGTGNQVTVGWAASDGHVGGSTNLTGQPIWLDRSDDGGQTWTTHLAQRTDGRTDSLPGGQSSWRACVTDTDNSDHCAVLQK